MSERDNYSKFSFILRLIFVFACVVLFIRVFSIFRAGQSNLSFTSFLAFLSNLDTFQINLSVSNFVISGNWGLFEGFRNFLNIFTSCFGAIVWLFSNIINVLFYLLQFLRFIFAS